MIMHSHLSFTATHVIMYVHVRVFKKIDNYYNNRRSFAQDKYDLTLLFFLKLGFVCYDDACHLIKYCRNPARKGSSPTSQMMSEMNIVVDKMHMAGHVDSWCKQHCDPKLFRELDEVSYYMYMYVLGPHPNRIPVFFAD